MKNIVIFIILIFFITAKPWTLNSCRASHTFHEKLYIYIYIYIFNHFDYLYLLRAIFFIYLV